MSIEPQRNAQRTPQRAPQRRVIYSGDNKFKYDETKVPPGMAYQWKRISLAGQEDTENIILAEMNGWDPVPASRHPELMGRRATDEMKIIRGGQMLMQQPKEWAQESRDLEDFAAKQTLEQQVQRYGLAAKRGGGKGVGRAMDVIPELVE